MRRNPMRLGPFSCWHGSCPYLGLTGAPKQAAGLQAVPPERVWTTRNEEAPHALDDHGSTVLDVADRDGDELRTGWVHPSPSSAGHRLGTHPRHSGTAARLSSACGAVARRARPRAAVFSSPFLQTPLTAQKSGDRRRATLRIPANREATHHPVAKLSCARRRYLSTRRLAALI